MNCRNDNMIYLSILIAILLICIPLYAASTAIEDGITSGKKLNLETINSQTGLNALTLDKYNICNKDDDGTPNYYGFQSADGSWIIMRWTVSAGADLFEYDSGTSDYATAWTGRALLTYKAWGDEF